jgi:ATP-binding protein involved in chromosome partitioning
MPTIEDIQQALTQVIDPELGWNIVELGMVRDIQIADGHVDITLALTIAGCPLRNQLQEQTRNAALSVPGVQSAEVKLTTMTDQQRSQLKNRLPPALNLNLIGRMVAVMSGKGGVGKSSVTALLATALKRQGYQVGILDADLTGPSILDCSG